MGVKHRIVLGLCRDAREGATLLGSNQPVGRMLAELDHEYDESVNEAKITTALNVLGKADKSFAMKVLAGGTYRSMGISKQLFSYRMKKILKSISTRYTLVETHISRRHSRKKF